MMIVVVIEERLLDFVEVRDVVESFYKMLCSKFKDDLEVWIDCVVRSLVVLFVNGVICDRVVIQNVIILMWLNGQIEGQIIKFKFIKWQMYGCGKLDLFEVCIVGVF